MVQSINSSAKSTNISQLYFMLFEWHELMLTICTFKLSFTITTITLHYIIGI